MIDVNFIVVCNYIDSSNIIFVCYNVEIFNFMVFCLNCINGFLEDGYNIIMNDIGLFIDGIIVMLVDYFLLVESDFFILCDSSFGFIVVGLSMCEIDSYILVD